MTIFCVDLPKESLIYKLTKQSDYSDAFQASFFSEQPIEIKNCFSELFFKYPKWIEMLMKIRKILVRPFNLKTGVNPHYQSDYQPDLKKGFTLSAFEVLDCTNQEILLEIKDRHLDAYISVLLLQIHKRYEVTLSTKVKYNNRLGRIYFFIIKPFHMIVVSAMLQNMIHKFNQHNKN
jgi:hypothetical protein